MFCHLQLVGTTLTFLCLRKWAVCRSARQQACWRPIVAAGLGRHRGFLCAERALRRAPPRAASVFLASACVSAIAFLQWLLGAAEQNDCNFGKSIEHQLPDVFSRTQSSLSHSNS